MQSADEWDELLVPEIERPQAEGKRVVFRADAAFAKPEIYDALEQRDVDYAIRIPANQSLEWEIAELLVRPPRRPSHKPLVRYPAGPDRLTRGERNEARLAKKGHKRGEVSEKCPGTRGLQSGPRQHEPG